MNKKTTIIILSIIIVLIGGYFLLFSKQDQGELNPDQPVFFYGFSCPHCKNVEEYFEESNVEEVLDIEIDKRETYLNRNNASLFDQIANDLEIPVNQRGVPLLVWGEEYVVGDTPIISYFEDKIKEIKDSETADSATQAETAQKIYNLPFIGEVDLMKYSLPTLTLVIGAVDGFNPCAMWVLVFLISALLGLENRKNMWIIGLTFIAASAAVYFLFMTAWLNLFLFIGYVRIVQIVIGVLALGVGFYYLREFWQKRSVECKVVEGGRKQRIIERINNIVRSKKFIYALGGIVILAFVVNLIELACSVGLPAIYTQILALSNLPKWQYYLYILGYTIVFMLDDMIIFTVAMVTVKATGLTGKYSRFSELIGGLLIFVLGVLLLIKPEWLMFA